MCLEKLSPGLPKWKEGYKTMWQKEDGIYGEVKLRGKKRPEGRWIDESEFAFSETKQIQTYSPSCEQSYPRGWHVFKLLKDAKRWMEFPYISSAYVVRKVKCRKPLAHGSQDCLEVGVFKEIMFVEREKGGPTP